MPLAAPVASALFAGYTPARMSVLLAGATGQLGRHVARELLRRRHHVRVLARSPERVTLLSETPSEIHLGDVRAPDSLRGACRGIDTVVSCVGASVMPEPMRPEASFAALDYRGNLNLLAEARRCGVKRFVYVSVYAPPELRKLAYVRAHEDFAEALAGSGLQYVVLRPVGFFSAFGYYQDLAMRGRPAPLIGSGEVRTNPIFEGDLARILADAMDSDEHCELSVGGPTTHSRRELIELAYRSLQLEPRLRSVPASAVRLGAAMARPIRPRIAALLSFYARISELDLVAPPLGKLEIGAYFRRQAHKLEESGTFKAVTVEQ